MLQRYFERSHHAKKWPCSRWACLCTYLQKRASYAFSCWMSEQVFSTSLQEDVRETPQLLNTGMVDGYDRGEMNRCRSMMNASVSSVSRVVSIRSNTPICSRGLLPGAGVVGASRKKSSGDASNQSQTRRNVSISGILPFSIRESVEALTSLISPATLRSEREPRFVLICAANFCLLKKLVILSPRGVTLITDFAK